MTTSAAGGVLETLRELVRTEVVARQLSRHLTPAPARVLDVGSSPARAVRLARSGCEVVLVVPDEGSREAALLACGPQQNLRSRVEVLIGSPGHLAAVVQRRFDLVLCHGGFGGVTDPREAVIQLSDLVAAGGVVSLVAPNADGMALPPALEQRWADALDLLLAAGDPEPVVLDHAGGPVRAHRLEELAAWVSGRRMHVESWYGVGLLTAGAPGRPPPADADEREAVLAAEEVAARTDPYRRVAPLLHVIGRRGTT